MPMYAALEGIFPRMLATRTTYSYMKDALPARLSTRIELRTEGLHP